MTRISLCSVFAALAACGGDTRLSTCDIREASCQLEVFLAVQDVRGSLWDPWIEPAPMEVISEAAYRAQVIAERERALQQTGVDYLGEGLKLLRMIDPNETPDQEIDFKVASVAAYYDSLTHRINIVDAGEPEDPALAVRTLAHELVHAAQDRDVGLGRLYQDAATTNNVHALGALLEGEAVTYAYLVDAKQLDIPKGALDWGNFDGWLRATRTRTFDALSPYRVASTELPYPLGGVYAAAAYVAGGPLAVRSLYDPPPLSASQFMAGRGMPGDVAPPAWTCGLTVPPSGYELALVDELGALAVYAFATRFALAEVQAWESARTWTGDLFQVWRRPGEPDALAVTWLVRCADASAAALLHALVEGVAWPELQIFLRGDTLHVLVSRGTLPQPYDAWTRCEPR